MQKIVSVNCPKCNNKEPMFYLGKNSFRNIALELIPMLNFDSNEWHA